MKKLIACAGLYWLAALNISFAGDLEPRRWSHLPIDTNFAGIGYIHTDGDVSFDPILKIEEATVEVDTAVVSYLRSFDLFGNTARFDIRLPYQHAHWEGLLDGSPASATREGLADPRFRLSINFIGAPALKGKEYLAYRKSHTKNTSVGAALAVTVPLGQYYEDKLLNLGENRFAIRPQLGALHIDGPWSYELTGSVLFFTDNDEFRGDNKREQKPLFALQSHIVRTFGRGLWASVSAGYDLGGESSINGEHKDDRRQELLFALSAGLRVSATSSVKAIYLGSRTQEDVGVDTDNFVLAFTTRF